MPEKSEKKKSPSPLVSPPVQTKEQTSLAILPEITNDPAIRRLVLLFQKGAEHRATTFLIHDHHVSAMRYALLEKDETRFVRTLSIYANDALGRLTQTPQIGEIQPLIAHIEQLITRYGLLPVGNYLLKSAYPL